MLIIVWWMCDCRGFITLLTVTCSKSTIRALEKAVKMCSKLTIETPERLQWQCNKSYCNETSMTTVASEFSYWLISNHLLFSLGSDSYKKIQLFKVHGKKFYGKSPLWDHSYCTYAVFWKFCAGTKWMITISISWLSFICFFQSRLFYTGEVTNVYVFQLLIV